MSSPLLHRSAALVLALGFVLAGRAEAADDPMGRVVAVEGTVRASAADGSGSRALAVGETIAVGDRVVTESGARASLSLDDAYVQLEADSAMRFARGQEGASDLDLERGRARVLDLRKPEAGGAPLRIATPAAEAYVAGGDTEAYILDEKAGRYALLCDWAAPLRVRRGGETITSAPPDCVVAKPDEPLYAAPGHGERLAVPEVASGPPLYGPIAGLFPPDIAAPPPLRFAGPPTIVVGPPFDPCEVGGTCVPDAPPPPPPPPGVPCNCARPPGGDPDPFGGGPVPR